MRTEEPALDLISAPEPAGPPLPTRLVAVRAALLASVVGGCVVAVRVPVTRAVHLWAVGIALLAFLGLMALEARRPGLSARTVALASGLLLVVALAGPARESRDVWAYAMYGRIAVAHDANPYTHPPATFQDDPFLARMDPAWTRDPPLYGPGFVGLAAMVAAVAGDSPTLMQLGFQALAALGVAACLWVVWRRTRSPAAVAILGLNPMVVVGLVNGGHLDAWIGLTLVVAVLLVDGNRPLAAGVALGLGTLLKVVVLLPAAVLVVWAWRRWGRRAGIAVGAATLAVAAIPYGVLAPGWGRDVGGAYDLISSISPWRLPRVLLLVARERGFEPVWLVRVGEVTFSISTMVLVGLALVLVWPRLRGASPALAVGAATLAYLLAGRWVMPWYVLWALPVLALARRSREAWIALGVGAVVLVGYLTTLLSATETALAGSARPYALLAIVALIGLAVAAARGALAERALAGSPSPLGPGVSVGDGPQVVDERLVLGVPVLGGPEDGGRVHRGGHEPDGLEGRREELASVLRDPKPASQDGLGGGRPEADQEVRLDQGEL